MNYSFKDVCNYVKKSYAKDSKVISAIDNIAGVAIIGLITGVAITQQSALPFGLLSVKNEITKLSKFIYNKLTKSRKDEDFLCHQERMRITYSLICYTSFFEAVDRLLPDSLRNAVELSQKDQEYILENKLNDSAATLESKGKASAKINIPVCITFPHPIESYSDQKNRLTELYSTMNKTLFKFIESSYIWDVMTDTEQNNCIKCIDAIPKEALKCFDSQYCELSYKFEDFCIWANLYEHHKTQTFLDNYSSFVQKFVEIVENDSKKMDIGFNDLREVIKSIPAKLKAGRSEEIVNSLKLIYDDDIEEAVIKDTEKESNDNMVFPKIKDAFIPQSYKVICKTDEMKKIEDENTWKNASTKNDLGAFITSFLSSPYSIETPLIILGHPGSGKSLLTKVLASALFSQRYTPIRIPLREVNASTSIHSQIEEYINKKTYEKIDSWSSFSSQFEDSPLVIILDGYDELLQASGKVFTGYLNDAKEFQRSLYNLKHPVRVIVTSRLTLIDKAVIPKGSTILRLLEFNSEQRKKWISIWNDANANFFESCTPKIEQFKLPNEEDIGANNILALAKQPLLLLMLAIFDSEGNKLKNSVNLDRTALYDSLLRRFIKREKLKSKNCTLNEYELENAIDVDMERLGATAIGMYNRRKLYIVSKELNNDILFFNQEKDIPDNAGQSLTQAEMLLGSFFFVQKSQVRQKDDNISNQNYDNIAFEFLHNTFGEFLTAYFIVLKTFKEVQMLHELNNSEILKIELHKKLEAKDSFSKEWYACLIYAHLSARPVIIQMIKEWKIHYLNRMNFSDENFIKQFDVILHNQINRVLTKQNMPSIIQGDLGASFGRYPLLGHTALFTLNLIILHTAFSESEFIFNEEIIETYEDGTKPWDRLTHIWRSWFSAENLNGLNTVFIANRDYSDVGSKVIIIPQKNLLLDTPSCNNMESILNVSEALGDNVTKCMALILSYDSTSDSGSKLNYINKLNDYEKIDIDIQIIIKRLLKKMSESPRIYNKGISRLISDAFRVAYSYKSMDEFKIILSLVQKFLLECRPNIPENYIFNDDFLNSRMMLDISERFPELASDITIIYTLAYTKKVYGNFIEFNEFFSRIIRNVDKHYRVRLITELYEVTKNSHFVTTFNNTVASHIDNIIKQTDFQYLFKREPEMFLDFCKAVREMGISTCMNRLFKEYLYDLDCSRKRINDYTPEMVLEILLMSKELEFLHMVNGIFEEIIDSYFIVNISCRPEIFIQILEIAMEMGDYHKLEILFIQYTDNLFTALKRNKISEYKLEVILDLFKFSKKFDFISIVYNNFKEYLLRTKKAEVHRVLYNRSENIFSLYKLAKELNILSYYDWILDKYFNEIYNERELERILKHQPKLFIEVIDFTIENKNIRMFETVKYVLRRLISSTCNTEHLINNAPIKMVQKLKILSVEFNDYNFQLELESLFNIGISKVLD